MITCPEVPAYYNFSPLNYLINAQRTKFHFVPFYLSYSNTDEIKKYSIFFLLQGKRKARTQVMASKRKGHSSWSYHLRVFGLSSVSCMANPQISTITKNHSLSVTVSIIITDNTATVANPTGLDLQAQYDCTSNRERPWRCTRAYGWHPWEFQPRHDPELQQKKEKNQSLSELVCIVLLRSTLSNLH